MTSHRVVKTVVRELTLHVSHVPSRRTFQISYQPTETNTGVGILCGREEKEKDNKEQNMVLTEEKTMAEGGEGKKKNKVMVAIDDSETSRYALDWALCALRNSLSSPLVIFTVQSIANLAYVPPAAYGSALGAVSMPPELIQSMQEHQKLVALSLLERAKKICAEKGVVAETITEVGDPKEAICEAVKELKIDLLILGSHNRGALQRAFLGSVSNYCVHHAKCPVLVVKRSE